MKDPGDRCERPRGVAQPDERFDMNDCMPEQWLPVVGYEGRYEVSDRARVRSLARWVSRKDGSGQWLPTRLMALTPHSPKVPYPKVSLCKNAVQRSAAVHRLVLEAFVGPCPTGMEACHEDGNHADSSLANLRWDTHQANYQDSVVHGTAHRDEPAAYCSRSHALTDDNVYVTRGVRTRRACRQCSLDRYQRTKQRTRVLPPDCPQGHEFTPENTIMREGRGRECRACKKDRRNRKKD